MVVNKNITKEYFLEKAGIRGGYARDMFGRLYDSVFSESENLVDTYCSYYQQEFDTLWMMLEKMYHVPQNVIENFKLDLDKNSDYTLIRFDSLSYGENIENLLSSGEFDERFAKLFLMKV